MKMKREDLFQKEHKQPFPAEKENQTLAEDRDADFGSANLEEQQKCHLAKTPTGIYLRIYFYYVFLQA